MNILIFLNLFTSHELICYLIIDTQLIKGKKQLCEVYKMKSYKLNLIIENVYN